MATQTERSPNEVESEAQVQNPEPVGPQQPFPTGVHDMVVSWDRNRGYMSVRVAGGRWWFKEMIGQALATGNDNSVGRIHLTAKGQLHREQLQLWRPSYATPHPMVYGTRREITLNRLCYYRAMAKRNQPCWRLRDNRLPWEHPKALVMLSGYVGDWNIEWQGTDIVAHLFHQGFIMICNPGCFLHQKGGYGHLYDQDRWDEADYVRSTPESPVAVS